MLGRRRAGAAAASVALRVAGSTFDALRAAWRSDASSGTRACVPGWAVICARAARRNPSWRSRRLLGERLKRVVGWLLRRPAGLMRIESKW